MPNCCLTPEAAKQKERLGLEGTLKQAAAPVAPVDASQSICTLTGLGDTMNYFQQTVGGTQKDKMIANGAFSDIKPVAEANGYVFYVQIWKKNQKGLLPLSEVMQYLPTDSVATMQQVQSYYTSLGMPGIYITCHSEMLKQRIPQYNGDYIVYESIFSDGTVVFNIKTSMAEHLKPM